MKKFLFWEGGRTFEDGEGNMDVIISIYTVVKNEK